MSRRRIGEGIGIVLGLLLGVLMLGSIALLSRATTTQDSEPSPTTASTTSTELQVRSAENEVPSTEGARVLQPNVSGQSNAVPSGGNCAGGTQAQALQGAICLNPQDLR